MRKQKLILAGATLSIMVILLAYYLAPLVTGYSRVTFDVVTTAGDETLMDDVLFFGDVFKGYDSEQVIVSNEETSYANSSSDISQYMGQELKIANLIERYPTFVHGKNAIIENFHETSDKIIYVDNYSRDYYNATPVPETQLTVSVFDKETGLETESNMTIEAKQPFHFAHVYSLLISNDYLVLDVAVDWLEDQMQTVVYDWKAGETVQTFDKPSILQTDVDNHDYTNFLVNEANNVLLVREENYIGSVTGHLEYQYAYSLFNLQDGTSEELEMPESFYQEDNLFYASEEGAFIISKEADQLSMKKFDLDNQTVAWQADLPMNLNSHNNEMSSFNLVESDEALLLTENYLNGPQDTFQFVFLNLEGFAVLSEGYLEMIGNENATSAYFEPVTYIK